MGAGQHRRLGQREPTGGGNGDAMERDRLRLGHALRADGEISPFGQREAAAGAPRRGHGALAPPRTISA